MAETRISCAFSGQIYFGIICSSNNSEQSIYSMRRCSIDRAILFQLIVQSSQGLGHILIGPMEYGEYFVVTASDMPMVPRQATRASLIERAQTEAAERSLAKHLPIYSYKTVLSRFNRVLVSRREILQLCLYFQMHLSGHHVYHPADQKMPMLPCSPRSLNAPFDGFIGLKHP